MREVLDILRAELGELTVVEHDGQRGDARDTAADITHAAEVLGYKPSWDVPRGLREQVAWHRGRRPAGGPSMPVASRG
jgi:nucleoside-diphosphate-sugar epimerase